MSDHLHGGAGPCPECEPDEWIRSSGGGDLPPGMAARIADRILAEPEQGTTSGSGHWPGGSRPGEWDHDRDSLSSDDAARGGNRRRPSGVPYGYGDPRRG